MYIKIILGLIVIAGLWLGILVYYKNKKSQDNKLFLIQAIFVVLWIVFNYMENDPLSLEVRKLFLYLDFIIAITWGFFWYLFCYNFLEEKNLLTRKNILFLFLSFLMSFFVINDYIIYDAEIVDDVIIFKEGSLFAVYALLALYYYLGGSVILFFKYKKFAGKKKIQSLYVLLGFLLTGAIVSITNLFFQNDIPIEKFRLVNISFIFLIGFSGYAIIRHSLFDIRIIVQRGLIYSFLLAVIVAFYLFLVFALGFILPRDGEFAIYISTIITTVVGIYGVPIIERRFRRITDGIFYKDRYDYSQAVYALSEILNRNLDLKVLLREANQKIKDTLKVTRCRTLLLERNIIIEEDGRFVNSSIKISKEISKKIVQLNLTLLSSDDIFFLEKRLKQLGQYHQNIELLNLLKRFSLREKIFMFVFIVFDDSLIAIVFLGDKLSGDGFSSEDVNLLKTFASQASIALVKSQFYAKVKEYSMDLEKKVAQRTSRIMGLQETQKQMMIEMSHGLQTPLTVIRGELDMIKDSIKDRAGVSRMERSLDKLSRFIYDMLNMAKLENINKDIKKEKLDLSVLLNELIEYFEVVTEEKGIKIKHEIEEGVNMTGNKERIEEMITNFVSNSAKYMKKSAKREIYIRLKKAGSKIELIIGDTGIGMSEVDLKNIFKKFYRSSDEVHSKIRGTGLGLAICKQIIDMHEGEVTVKSKVGKGTKFTIIFPSRK